MPAKLTHITNWHDRLDASNGTRAHARDDIDGQQRRKVAS